MTKLVIFDMAGTSIDEDNIVYKTIQRMLADHGYDRTLDQVLEIAAGKEKRDAIASLLEEEEGVDGEKITSLYTEFNTRLQVAYGTEDIKVFESLHPLLNLMEERGIIAAFNTGYNEKIATQILDRVGIHVGDNIHMLVTADMVEKSRPHPDMIQKILNHFEVDASEAVKIGDSQIDIEEGKNANLKYSIGITTGAHSREQLQAAQPDFILDDLTELINIL